MGATHKETVTELVKGMLQSGMIKPAKDAKHPIRDVLKKSILLVEYGTQIYRDPEFSSQVNAIITAEKKEKMKPQPKVTNDLNSLKKKTSVIKK